MTRSTNSNENSERSPKQGRAAGAPLRLVPPSWLLSAAPYLLLLVGWIALFFVLDLGWLPHDDGTLAHAADRINAGEMPHRDFDEPYTGGLSYVNAVSLKLLGNDLMSLRYPLWLLVAPWLLVCFSIAERFMPPLQAAAAVTILGIGSRSMHLSPMPTWYLLTLGTLALFCCIRYMESGSRSWLFSSGLIVGSSFLVKSSGLVFGLGIGLILSLWALKSESTRNVLLGKVFCALALFSVALLLASDPTPARYVSLLLPLLVVVWSEWNAEETELRASKNPLMTELLVLGSGVMIPLVAYGVLFWVQGGIERLVVSLVKMPSLVGQLGVDAPALLTLGPPLVSGYLLWRHRLEDRPKRIVLAAAAGLLGIGMYLLHPGATLLAGFSVIVWVGLFAAVIYALVRHRTQGAELIPILAVLVTALCFELVKFPASNNYFTFMVLPMTGLALLGVVRLLDHRVGFSVLVVLAALVLMFVVGKLEGRWMTTGTIGSGTQFVSLKLDRGGIRVPIDDAYYADLVDHLDRFDHDLAFLAAPDSPEVYFLSGRQNRTPVFFEALSDGLGHANLTYGLIESGSLNLLVNNTVPVISQLYDVSSGNWQDLVIDRYGPFEIFERRTDP